MDKATIADVLEKIATLLELKDENPFKIRAYTNAARSLAFDPDDPRRIFVATDEGVLRIEGRDSGEHLR